MSTKRTSAFFRTRIRRSKMATKSASSRPSPAAEPAAANQQNVMPKVSSKPKKTGPDSPEQTRLWLMYPPKLIKEPLLWQLSNKFEVVTNIRQASVTDEIGIVSLELKGKRAEIKAAIQWLEKLGV